MGYQQALQLQTQTAQEVRSGAAPNSLISLQHPPVYTIGKRETSHNFKVPIEVLESEYGAEVYRVRRGGEVTFHGPGQAVLYPILNLRGLGLGPRRYVEGLEDVMVQTCALYGVAAHGRRVKETGVWVEDRKIGAIGVQISEGVTMHGLALNVNTDLEFFEHIVPCGLEGKSVTSLQNELSVAQLNISEAEHALITSFGKIFSLHT